MKTNTNLIPRSKKVKVKRKREEREYRDFREGEGRDEGNGEVSEFKEGLME